MIPAQVERRARWVLESIGAREVGFGDDVPYRADAWGAIERGERPDGDELAEAFYDLARIEELTARRDVHDRFLSSESSLDPLDPPLERLRAGLGIEPPTWDGARFAVALTHDVDSVRRWTRIGVRGAAARAKADVRARRFASAGREAAGLARVPFHKLRGTDPNWRFDEVVRETKRHGASDSTWFLLAGHRDVHDGAAPEVYERLRPRLIETLTTLDVEIGLHGSYTAARDSLLLAAEKERLEREGARVRGHRYHYLRLDPHRNLEPLADLRLRYDSSLAFANRVGFRGGIARPFHPWDLERDEPLDIVELPLAVMDASFEARYLDLTARQAWPLLEWLLDWAAANGAGFAILWHTDRFDPPTAAGWDRLFYRVIDAVHERGGRCLSAERLIDIWANGQ